jgi:type IV pilus assembly protein PilE
MLSPAAQTEGFTLVELLLAVLLVALLVTIAWPTWSGYQADAVVAVLRSNVQSMALFQEDYRIRYGRYATDLADREQIAEVIGWQLAKDDGSAYAIDPVVGDSYTVRAVARDGPAICLIMPSAQSCPD